MSLLLNEDFTTYQLREAYLSRLQDGVGERLISLNPAVLHNPAFRAAGWLPNNAAIRRCHSPPIPTAGAGVSSEYFRAPARTLGTSLEDEAEGAFGLGARGAGAEEGTGLAGLGISSRQRRRRKQPMEEDDSSDLSDDSDDDDQRVPPPAAPSSVRTARLQQNNKAVSFEATAPDADADQNGPSLLITSPSRPSDGTMTGLRRGSIGAVEAVKQRARRDTTTSSEFSSDNELDANIFARQMPGRPGRRNVMLTERIAEEDQQLTDEINDDTEDGDSDMEDDVGEASDLSDEFEVQDRPGDSPKLIALAGGMKEDVSPPKPPPDMPSAVTPQGGSSSPRKLKESVPKLAKLPSGKSVSATVPPSLITMALKGKTSPGEKPFQRFADFSGKGEAGPLWIKIYAPFSANPSKPIEVPLRRAKDGNPVLVMDLIGLALWRYVEEEIKPVLADKDLSVNRWTLRIVEDEEIDFDFPALNRMKPVGDFTSNNNRPPQRRARDKPWDEFGLARATDAQFKENEALTPQDDALAIANLSPVNSNRSEPERPAIMPRAYSDTGRQSPRPTGTTFNPVRNPITEPSFVPNAPRREIGNLLDKPQRENTQSTPRTGAAKIVMIQFTDPQSFAISNLQIPTTTDTYIAELHDHSCKKLNLDKALYVLKVHGTQTVAPSDRTVEALGERVHLDLVRRRFAGAGDGVFGLGLSGSPGSSTPNAPLDLPTVATPPTKKKKGFGLNSRSTADAQAFAYAQNASLGGSGSGGGGNAFYSFGNEGKRYNVLRKLPLSFAAAHPRTLIITPEYLQILPAAPAGSGLSDSPAPPPTAGKVTNIAMAMIIGVKVSRKHPKMVRVIVFGERAKRYDFECASPNEAQRICADIRSGLPSGKDGVFWG